jgi:hypothetical protein
MLVQMDESGDEWHGVYLFRFIIIAAVPIFCLIYFIMRLTGAWTLE